MCVNQNTESNNCSAQLSETQGDHSYHQETVNRDFRQDHRGSVFANACRSNLHMHVHYMNTHLHMDSQNRCDSSFKQTPLCSSREQFPVSPSEWKAFGISSHLLQLGEKRALCQQSRDLLQPNVCHLSDLSVCHHAGCPRGTIRRPLCHCLNSGHDG